MTAKTPSTNAIRTLRKAGVQFQIHRYQYQQHGGAAIASESLGVPPHQVIKTIVLEDERAQPLLVLMHGDRSISTKRLARALDVKRIIPCTPEVALRTTGYQVGGTSPLGTRTPIPTYAEATIDSLATLYINGGARGLLLEMRTRELMGILRPTKVRVQIPLNHPSSPATACR